jgi:hypothetical protein
MMTSLSSNDVIINAVAVTMPRSGHAVYQTRLGEIVLSS